VPLVEPTAFESWPGHGVAATLEGRRRLIVGSARLLAEAGVPLADADAAAANLASHGRTVMFIAEHTGSRKTGGRVLGVLGLADTPRAEAREAIAGMRRLDWSS
jgi:cation transport ATPase